MIILFEESVYYWSRVHSLDFHPLDEERYLSCQTTFFLASELGIVHYAFIRTDCFAGIGVQRTLIMENTTIISKEVRINDALRKFGVLAEKDKDEFNALNLGRYRGMEEYYWDTEHNFALKQPNMLPRKIFKGWPAENND